jgi:hypothetical protein
MSSERENANGPTQVHPALNFNNDLTQHIHLNGLNGMNNGINGIIGGSKPFAERGELSSDFHDFPTIFATFLTQKSKKFRNFTRRTKIFTKKHRRGMRDFPGGNFQFSISRVFTSLV